MAYVFGGTVLHPQSLITQIAARDSPDPLSSQLVRYTRALTAIWAAYFFVSALLFLVGLGGGVALAVGLVLFIGEYGLRRLIFRDQNFPDLIRQIRSSYVVVRAISAQSVKRLGRYVIG